MNKELSSLEALCYLYDIVHGRKIKYHPHELKLLIERDLRRKDYLEITAIDIEQDNKELCKENKKLKQVLEIIKEFAYYQIVNVQGQWYIMQGVSFDKSLKLPITEEQAILLQEILLCVKN